jgi:hypothetical protein
MTDDPLVREIGRHARLSCLGRTLAIRAATVLIRAAITAIQLAHAAGRDVRTRT